MVSLLVSDLVLSEELLDKDEAVLDKFVIAHLGWTISFCHYGYLCLFCLME